MNKKKSVSKKSKALKHKDYLTLLSKAKNVKRRKLLIDLADCSEVRAISECIANVLTGNVRLNTAQKKKLKKHKKVLRFLMDKKPTASDKKKVLYQKGGFLTALLPLALSAVSSLLPAIFGTNH